MMTEPLFDTPATAAIFSPEGRAARMLAVEAALAQATAALGLAPAQAAATVVACCSVDQFTIADWFTGARLTGNPAIPMVADLTRAVNARDPAASVALHVGATSQDILDSATMLQMRDALDAILADCDRGLAALAALARRHRATPMMGRTLLQPALPISFGVKAAGWLSALGRVRRRLGLARTQGLALQYGGAVGSFAELGLAGLDLAADLARRLDLPLPDLPWHSARDRIGALGADLALLAGCLGKIARDVTLLMQPEIGEAAEPAAPGRGGSSAMPHKRNPVACLVALAAAELAPQLAAALLAGAVQEHERATGAWHAEWLALPQLTALAHAATVAMADCLEGLQVDTDRMAANIAATQGLYAAEALRAALTPQLGRAAAAAKAEALARHAVAGHLTLAETVAGDAELAGLLDDAARQRLFDPLTRLAAADRLIDRALADIADLLGE